MKFSRWICFCQLFRFFPTTLVISQTILVFSKVHWFFPKVCWLFSKACWFFSKAHLFFSMYIGSFPECISYFPKHNGSFPKCVCYFPKHTGSFPRLFKFSNNFFLPFNFVLMTCQAFQWPPDCSNSQYKSSEIYTWLVLSIIIMQNRIIVL